MCSTRVHHTVCAQGWITQRYLQLNRCLPLPRKHSPDGASQTEVADILLQPTTHLSTPKGGKAESAWLADLQQTVYDMIQYDSVYLMCSKKLTGSQLSLPHGINKKIKI